MVHVAVETMVFLIVLFFPAPVASETPSCPPLAFLNESHCASTTSAFQSCACTVFRDVINKIMADESCLFENISKMIEQQNKVPVTVVEPQRLVQQSEEKAVSDAMKNNPVFKMLEEYAPVLMSAAHRIFDQLIAGFCQKAELFKTCLGQKVMQMTNDPFDQTLVKIIDVNHVAEEMKQVCNLRTDILKIFSCDLKKLFIRGMGCVGAMYDAVEALSKLQINATNIQGHLCPLLGDFMSCIGIQMQDCSPNFGQWLTTTAFEGLHGNCKTLALKGTKSMGSSKLVQCAIPTVLDAYQATGGDLFSHIMGPGPENIKLPELDIPQADLIKIISEFEDIKNGVANDLCKNDVPLLDCIEKTVPSSKAVLDDMKNMLNVTDFADMVRKLKIVMAHVCRDIKPLFQCVHRETSRSQNVIDKLVRDVVDFDHLKDDAHIKQIVDKICSTKTVEAMDKAMPCIGIAALGMKCTANQQLVSMFDFKTSVYSDGTTMRKNACGDIKNITECAIENVLAKCDPNVRTLAMDLKGWLLRTDCDGKRPSGQFEELKAESGGSHTFFQSVLLFLVIANAYFVAQFVL